jgi:hypothetical protein
MKKLTFILAFLFYSQFLLAEPESGFYSAKPSAVDKLEGLGRIEVVRLMYKPNEEGFAEEMPSYSHYLVLYIGEPIIIDIIDGHTPKIEIDNKTVTIFFHSGGNAYLYKKYEVKDQTLKFLEEGNART